MLNNRSLAVVLLILALVACTLGCKKSVDTQSANHPDSIPPEDLDKDPGTCEVHVYGKEDYRVENEKSIHLVKPLFYVTKKESGAIEVQISAAPFIHDDKRRGKLTLSFDDEPPFEMPYRIKYYTMMNAGFVDSDIVLLADEGFLKKLQTAAVLNVDLNCTEGVQKTSFDLKYFSQGCPFTGKPTPKPNEEDEGEAEGGTDSDVTPDETDSESGTEKDAKPEKSSAEPVQDAYPDIISTLKFKNPSVDGDLDKRIILKIIRNHSIEIKNCYEAVLAKADNPKAIKGQIELEWLITPEGKVDAEKTRLNKSELNNQEVESCIIGVINNIRFPEPKSGSVKVNYPLEFEN